MSTTIDYYFAPNSPYVYLGHARFTLIAHEAGAVVRLLPIDLGKVFAVSGGLPLGKRAPQRQAYRLVELARWSRWLGIPLHPQPKFFPVAADDAARLIIAVDRHDGVDAAMALTGAVTRAVWAHERDIADAGTLTALLVEQNLPAQRLVESRDSAVQSHYEANTQRAIDAGVFGAPSYGIDGELFWGQDRLDFIERRLRTAP